ncbi:MAG TPA: hypothetical protein VGJ20_44460 [Xanthobacteraceae bacterium]|jgi:hypothetical protein
MSAADPRLKHHPAPQRHALPPLQSFFALFGGPLAWFLQLNADFALASNPCFLGNERAVAPQLAGDWTWSAMISIAAVACAIALVATLTAWRAYRLTKQESSGDHHDLMEIGAGRTRFLAFWALCLGAGSALLIVLTALAFFVLPRCAG